MKILLAVIGVVAVVLVIGEDPRREPDPVCAKVPYESRRLSAMIVMDAHIRREYASWSPSERNSYWRRVSVKFGCEF